MKLNNPFKISPRLMAALEINGAWLSLEFGDWTKEGRIGYHGWLDLPDGSEHEITDLCSGVGGENLQSGFEALLSFLGAAAESRQYHQRTGNESENEDLFEPAVVEWAAQNRDELSMLEFELQENPGLIEE